MAPPFAAFTETEHRQRLARARQRLGEARFDGCLTSTGSASPASPKARSRSPAASSDRSLRDRRAQSPKPPARKFRGAGGPELPSGMPGASIEPWKVQEVLRYLAKAFPNVRLDDYPRGSSVAHLFVLREASSDPRKGKRHHLMITRQFFERYNDVMSLKDALESADVARTLARAGDRTVDLH
jgi:hypothetical protein